MTSLTRCTKVWIGLLLTTIPAQNQASSGWTEQDARIGMMPSSEMCTEGYS